MLDALGALGPFHLTLIYLTLGLVTLGADNLCRSLRPGKYERRQSLPSHLFVFAAWPVLWTALLIIFLVGGLFASVLYAVDRLDDLFGER